MDWAKTTTRRDVKHFSLGIRCAFYSSFDGLCNGHVTNELVWSDVTVDVDADTGWCDVVAASCKVMSHVMWCDVTKWRNQNIKHSYDLIASTYCCSCSWCTCIYHVNPFRRPFDGICHSTSAWCLLWHLEDWGQILQCGIIPLFSFLRSDDSCVTPIRKPVWMGIIWDMLLFRNKTMQISLGSIADTTNTIKN